MNTRIMVSHTDCRNFFATCELTANPKLKGVPVGVLSNNDGNIVARSGELKALGVKMGEAPFKIKDLLMTNKVELFSSNYELYGPISQRVYAIGAKYSPSPYKYSIDEFFQLHYDWKGEELRDHMLKMCREVKQKTGILISSGVAPTMALAKVATKIAKDFEKDVGRVYVIDSIEKRDKALRWMPIRDVWGIGRQQARKLQVIGVETAYDFITKANDAWTRKNMTVVGLRLKHDLMGTRCIFFEKDQPKKGINVSRSFALNTGDYDFIRERVVSYAVQGAETLRRDRSVCRKVTVQMITPLHREDLPQNFDYFEHKLPFPTSSSIQIAKAALFALRQAYKDGFDFKKVEVFLSDITPEANAQTTMFTGESEKERVVMSVVDRLNDQYGGQKLMLAGQDIYQPTKSRISRLSKRYLTRWDEMLEINCTGKPEVIAKPLLTVSEIAPYLNHKLRFCNIDSGSGLVFKELVAVNFEKEYVMLKGEPRGRKLGGNWIPVLRSLEDLGLKQLIGDVYFTPAYNLAVSVLDLQKCIRGTKSLRDVLTDDDLRKVFAWHFDVDGLIKRGLARRYDSLKNQIQH